MNKNFWKNVVWIGLPVALQNLINNVLNICDTLMISNLGEEYIAAIGLANKIFFVLSLLLFGIVSGSSILLAQYYGKNDHKSLNKVFFMSMMLVALSGVIFFCIANFIPHLALGILSNDQTLIDIGCRYLKIASYSYLFTSISMGISGILKSTGRTRLPMVTTIFSVIVNVIINFLLINGNLGCPRLEEIGAAIGTTVSRAIELTILLFILLFCKRDFKLMPKEIKNISSIFLKAFLAICIPVILNETFWGLGTTLMSSIYGHMSSDTVTVMTISQSLTDLIYAFLFGFSNACAVLVGQQLGADRLDDAKVTAKKLLKASLIASVILGITLVLITNPFILLFNKVSSNNKNNIFIVCTLFAIFMPFKAFNLTNICGVLRSGGDTIFTTILDISGVWLMALPLGAFAAFILDLSIGFVYFFILLEEFMKMIFGFIRYKKYYWLKNITLTEPN